MWRKGHNNNNHPSVGTKLIWLLIFASSIASSTTTGFTSVNSNEYIQLDAPLFSAFACFIVPPFFFSMVFHLQLPLQSKRVIDFDHSLLALSYIRLSFVAFDVSRLEGEGIPYI